MATDPLKDLIDDLCSLAEKTVPVPDEVETETEEESDDDDEDEDEDDLDCDCYWCMYTVHDADDALQNLQDFLDHSVCYGCGCKCNCECEWCMYTEAGHKKDYYLDRIKSACNCTREES